MTGLEAYFPALSKFLLGLGQKCIVSAVKLWKEKADKEKSDAAQKLLTEHETAKRIAAKMEQRVTASIRGLQISTDHLNQILALETDPLLKPKLADLFLSGVPSAKSIADLFVEQDPGLEGAYAEVLVLANLWLDAIDKSIAEEPVVARWLNLRSTREIRTELSSIGEHMLKAELRQVQTASASADWQGDTTSRLSEIKALLLPRHEEGSSSISGALKTQNQKRFDRARYKLLEGSVLEAEHEFQILIEDLQGLENTDDDLLLRSYINLASALWEQNRKEAAVEWFDKSYTRSPNDWRAKQGHAFALVWRGQPDRAIEIFRALRILKSDNADYLYNEAWLLKNTGRHDEAIQLLEENVLQEAQYYSILSLAYLAANRYEDAEIAARSAIGLEPENQAAQQAISYAIGFPIIEKRHRREMVTLSLSPDSKRRLSEAIAYAETAKATLRRAHRLQSLSELLTNLSAFYAALGSIDQAVESASEALELLPTDTNVLVNLWCAQMQSGDYDAAVTTADRMLVITNSLDAWEKRMQSLLAAHRDQEVIEDWEQNKTRSDFERSSDVIALVARALSKRHRSDVALQLINNVVNESSPPASLLAERGLILERLGDIPEAEQSLVAAEAIATIADKTAVIADAGMFFYRRGKWDEAIRRFGELGGASPENPFFTNYLICTFNIGDYHRCVTLADLSVKNPKAFIEDHHAIAARCHHIIGNLQRARDILDKLVSRGTNRELEYRKLLGWTFWRLDDLPQSYDVLVKSLLIRREDLDTFILLSGICSAMGRHKQAITYAREAVGIAPTNAQSHAALVRAVFSATADTKIASDDADAHFRSLTFLEQHESGLIKTIPIEPNLKTMLELLRERFESVQRIEKFYDGKKLPMGFFGRAVGCSPFALWTHLLKHRRFTVRMAFGNGEEQQTEIDAAAGAGAIVIDPMAVFTLQSLGLLELLPRFCGSIFAHGSLLDSIVTEIRHTLLHPNQGTLIYHEGKIVHSEQTPEQRVSKLKFLESIRDFLKSGSVQFVGVPAPAPDDIGKTLLDTCGEAFIFPLLVAHDRKATLFSDDAVVRQIGTTFKGVRAFCTQAFLRVAQNRTLVTADAYEDALIGLISSNYTFVSEDAGTLRREFVRSNGRATPFARTLINRVNNSHFVPQSCLPSLAEFLVFVWSNKQVDGASSREDWASLIWEAVSKAKNREGLLSLLVGKICIYCLTRPGVFNGIVQHAIRDVIALRKARPLLYAIMQEANATVYRSLPKVYPGAIVVQQEWREQRRLNQLLLRRGWLRIA